jgi:hypothetical protein
VWIIVRAARFFILDSARPPSAATEERNRCFTRPAPAVSGREVGAAGAGYTLLCPNPQARDARDAITLRGPAIAFSAVPRQQDDLHASHFQVQPSRPSSHREYCDIVPGVFTPVLAKHTKSFNLIDTLAVGVDRIQRSFEPMRHQVELWRQTQLSDDTAKLILYRAFVEGELDAPRSLLSEVHRLYFQPQYGEFSSRTMWSLSNAFTNAFKDLDPVPQFKVTAKLGAFLSQLLA